MNLAKPSRRNYWRQTLRVSVALLLLWLVVTLGAGLFGRSLTGHLFGWPIGLWITAQGALLVFCGIVWCYAIVMDRIDRRSSDHEED